jgi:hypothetical protein
VARADGAQVVAGQVAVHVDPKCHLDFGQAELPASRRVQSVEGLSQPDKLIADLKQVCLLI